MSRFHICRSNCAARSNHSLLVSALLVAFILMPPRTESARASEGASAWEQVADGLEYRWIDGSGAAVPVSAHVFRLSLEELELRVLPAGKGEGAYVSELARSAHALLAVNGGFFLEDFTPLGLLVSQGRELNPIRRADWGVFYVARGRAGLVHRREWKAPAGLEFAIEAGPRLVVDGRPLTLKPQSARRTALGIQRDGRVVVVATPDRVLTSDLARMMAAPETDGGLGCRFALNLDGGSSTQLWHPAHKVPALARVANAVALFPRK